MQPDGDPVRALAQRLRALRDQWSDVAITQQQLAEALGTHKSVSVPLISSWESLARRVVPPADRLDDYATFFSTRRSVAVTPYRLLDLRELSREERLVRDQLAGELKELRDKALVALAGGPETPVREVAPDPWRFTENQDITIVCAELPAEVQPMPYADPDNPDYFEMFTFADPDALIELYGHVRAANPVNNVIIKKAPALDANDYTAHLVVLGGVDWNSAASHLLDVLDVPVTQVSRDLDTDNPEGYFAVVKDGVEVARHRPFFGRRDGKRVLLSDVAHFYRGPNPYNRERTVTLCNGMFSKGTLGAVRSLIDPRFRNRNAAYISKRFSDAAAFSILTRVHVLMTEPVTPDWAVRETRLHEWPEADK